MARPVTGKVAKTSRMELRIEPEEAEAYDRAAAAAGQSRSEWIRDILNTAAKPKKKPKIDSATARK